MHTQQGRQQTRRGRDLLARHGWSREPDQSLRRCLVVAQSLYHPGEPLGDTGRGLQQWTWQYHRCLRTQGLGTGAKGCDGSPPGASCLPLQDTQHKPRAAVALPRNKPQGRAFCSARRTQRYSFQRHAAPLYPQTPGPVVFSPRQKVTAQLPQTKTGIPPAGVTWRLCT